jgi:GTP-binding protein
MIVTLFVMKVLEAEFLLSATDPAAGAGWPADSIPEIAFAGRSNVGKSTLLQALLQRRGLVRISSTPGRTRLINFFRVVIATGPTPADRRELRLVDLPGYGYAKVAKSEREKWLPFVDEYLARRPQLKAVVMLLDPRREVGLDETEIVRYVSEREGVAVLPVMTKADKLSKHERKPTLAQLGKELGRPALAVSATDGDGVDELWRRLVVALGPAAS